MISTALLKFIKQQISYAVKVLPGKEEKLPKICKLSTPIR